MVSPFPCPHRNEETCTLTREQLHGKIKEALDRSYNIHSFSKHEAFRKVGL